VDVLAALELPLVPPGGSGVGERSDLVARFGGSGGAAQNDLERAGHVPALLREKATRSRTWSMGGMCPCFTVANSGAAPSHRDARRIGHRYPPIQIGGRDVARWQEAA